MKWLIILFCVISLTTFGQKTTVVTEEENVLWNASSLPFILGYQYSSVVLATSTKNPVRNYLKENPASFRFADHEFYFRYAILNTPRFNFQLGACLGFSNYLLVDYYRSITIDSVQYSLVNPRDEQYLFKRLGLSYEANILVDKGLKGNHGAFLQGDLSLKIDEPGQRSAAQSSANAETSAYYFNSASQAQLDEQLTNGNSWNKIGIGYQITRQLSPYVDGQLKVSYGFLWGVKNPFGGSQIYSVGLAFGFGKRKPAKPWFEKESNPYKYKKNRPKYE